MRISELSQAGDVPVATIKYYLRERLLPPGQATAANQSHYGQPHLHRLRLIRVLRDVADLPIATIREILAAVDDQTLPVHEVLGVAHTALAPPAPPHEDRLLADARVEIDALLDRLGWAVSAHAPARTALAHALASLRRLGRQDPPEGFRVYAEAADRVAAWELDHVAATGGRDQQVEGLVVGTVVYEAVLTALRRLAHEHHSALRFGGSHPDA